MIFGLTSALERTIGVYAVSVWRTSRFIGALIHVKE